MNPHEAILNALPPPEPVLSLEGAFGRYAAPVDRVDRVMRSMTHNQLTDWCLTYAGEVIDRYVATMPRFPELTLLALIYASEHPDA